MGGSLCMASYGPTLRPSAAAAAAATEAQPDQGLRTTYNKYMGLARPWRPVIPFGLPPDPEAAAVRAVRNVVRYRLYYALLLWVILFFTLIPRRPTSLICLVVTSHAAVTYALFMLAFPSVSAVVHRLIDRRLVAGLFVIGIVVEMVLTRALKHLLLSAAGAAPLVLIHAVLRVDGDLWAASGELDKLVGEEGISGDLESGSL